MIHPSGLTDPQIITIIVLTYTASIVCALAICYLVASLVNRCGENFKCVCGEYVFCTRPEGHGDYHENGFHWALKHPGEPKP